MSLTFQESLASFLRGIPAITSVVGSSIYPVYAGLNAPLPTLVFRIHSRKDDLTLAGPAALAVVTLEIQALANEYDQAHALAESVRSQLAYFRGQLGNPDGVQVEGCLFQGLEDVSPDMDVGIFVVNSNYLVHYQIN